MCRERVHDVSKRWLGGRCKTTVGDARKSVGTIEPLTAPLEADFPFVFVFFHVLTLGKKKIRASSRTYLPPFKLVSTRRGGEPSAPREASRASEALQSNHVERPVRATTSVFSESNSPQKNLL